MALIKQAHEQKQKREVLWCQKGDSHMGVGVLRLCARFKAGRFQITQTARTRICIRHVLAGSGIRGHSCPAHIQSKYKVAIADGIGISNSVNSTQGIMHTECRVLPFLCHYISLPHAS